MTTKTKNIIHWVLAGLVAFIFVGSAVAKLTADEVALQGAANFGLDATTYSLLGAIELISVLLFLVPRTSIIGSLLLIAYLGGAVATHLEHKQAVFAPVLISVFLWIVIFVRNPELSSRILGKKLTD